VGDARSHLTGANDADGLDFRHGMSPRYMLCRSRAGPARNGVITNTTPMAAGKGLVALQCIL
jgi:hypothetical protein